MKFNLYLLGLVGFMFAAPAVNAQTRIEIFSPTGEAKKVSQVKVRFSGAMSSLGDPRQDAPFVIVCSTQSANEDSGRWVDSENWVFDFKSRLPSGTSCSFTPVAGLTDITGNQVRTKSAYRFHTGGPQVRYSRPYDGNRRIAEDQFFRLSLDGEADKASVEELAWCEIEGLAEKVPVQVLDAPEGQQSSTSDLWLKCQNALPANAKVRLIWEKGIRSKTGIAASSRQTFTFTVRAPFSANFSCSRTSIKQPCSPLSDLHLHFTAPITLENAGKIELHQQGYQVRYPKRDSDRQRSDTRRITFEGPFDENARLKVVLPEGIRDDADRALKNATSFPLSFATGSYPPLIKFSANFGILEHKTGGVLPVSIRAVESPLPNQSINIASNADFIKTKDPFEILNWIKRVQRVKWGDVQTKAGKWVDFKNNPHPSLFTENDSHQSFTMPEGLGDKALEVIGIPLRDPGFYVVELKSQILGAALHKNQAPYHVATSALVTNMAVHFLWGADRSAIWVTHLDSGKPVANAKLQVGNECTKQILWSGTTDKDGLAYVEHGIPASNSWTSCRNQQNPPLIITANKAKDFSFTRTAWNDGLNPWQFGIDTGYSGDRIKVHSVLDRSLFRAGETASFKHFLRENTATGIGLVRNMPKKSHIKITHIGSGQIMKFPVEFDAYGRADSQWKIPKDARLGQYQISIEHKAGSFGDSARFRVEEFKIPMMQAFLRGPSAPVVGAEQLQVSAMVRYLAGGGASGQSVRLISNMKTDWRGFDAWPAYSFGYQDIQVGTFDRGEAASQSDPVFSSDQTAVLDANGSANITLAGLPTIKQRQSLRTELEYQDANGEFLTKSASFALWPAAVALGIKTEGWAASEDNLKFSVLAIGADEKILRGQQVTVKLFREKNLSWRKRMVGGFYAYENERKVSLLADSCSGKTDKDGRLFCKLKPGISGEILLQATAIDDQGNTAQTTSSVWLVGEDDWWFDQQQGDRMDLLVETAELEDGDSARVQVRSPFRSAMALVSIQREGVIDSFVTKISGRNPVIEVPIKGGYAPNIYLSVLAVRGRVNEFDSWLADTAREHDLPWVSRDGGRPTGLVDLSKPSFRLGVSNIKVGHKAFRLNVGVTTDQDSYAIRGVAKVKVKVTAANGDKLPKNTEVTLAVVDAGLLQLSPNTSWNILDAFMKPRGLQVFTSTAQMQIVGKRHYGRKAVAPGGGGADEVMMSASMMAKSAAQPNNAKPREMFDTLLLWRGSVKLDENGMASLDIPINDSLTAFEVVAIANDGAAKFGTGKTRFTVTQDIQLISALPPVVRENDLFTATFTVRNTTQTAQALSVEARNSIGRALDPVALTIPAGEAREAKWQVLIPFDQTEVKWQVQAVLQDQGTAADQMIITQKIVPAIPVTVMQSTISRLDQIKTWPVQRAIDAIPGRGGLEVVMQSKLGTGFASVKTYMAQYPYSCFEQRASVAVALNDQQLWTELMGAMPAYLDSDGLVKYFVSDLLQGSDILTAYLLKIADATGWQFSDQNANAMQNGLQAFIQGRLKRSLPVNNAALTYRKLSAINALGRYGKANAQMLTSLEFSAALLPTSALLDWIGILERIKDIPNRVDKLTDARAQLRVRLDLQGTRLNFSTETKDRMWWLMETIDANAARTLIATQKLNDWQSDAPRLSLGLISRQQHGRWRTTTANAWAMVAMRKFSERFEKTPVLGQTKIAYGPQTKMVNWPKDSNPKITELDWQKGQGVLRLQHQGQGNPWAFITAKAAVPLQQPLSAGYRIIRTISAVERKDQNSWHVGDVMKIRLEIHANSDMTWVVVDDPVPAGATILGKGLQTSSQRLSQTRSSGYAWPVFTERKFETYTSYYRFVPAGEFSLEYTVRLNTAGRYQLPPSRVEAMYAPEMFGAVPIDELVIKP